MGSMKTLVGVGYCLTALNTRVVKKAKKKRRATHRSKKATKTTKPLKSHREPLLGKNKRDPLSSFGYWTDLDIAS